MSRIFNIHDKVNINDRPGMYGEVTFGKGLHKVPYTDIYGNKDYKLTFDEVLYKDHNIIPIGGYQFAFDKIFNIGLDQESNLKVGDLNDEKPGMKIGVSKSDYQSQNYTRESTPDKILSNNIANIPATNAIFGFMVGDGGSALDNMTAIAPNYKNRTLYNAIPFKTVDTKYTVNDPEYYSYFGCTKLSDDKYQYFVKRFDTSNTPHIINSWVADGTETDVDDTVFSSTSTNAIETYVEMGLTIDSNDCRSEDLTTAPRVNEIALVSGWFNETKNDYECIRLFSHFTRPSITLASGDKIEILYRVYAR